MSLPYRGVEILEGELYGGMLSAKIIVYENEKLRPIYRMETRADSGLHVERLPFVDAKEGEVVCHGAAIEDVLNELPNKYHWTLHEFLCVIDGFQQGRERTLAEERQRNTVELTEDWQQGTPSQPLAFLVKCFRAKPNVGDEYRVFTDVDGAKHFAEEQYRACEELECTWPDDWKIYPLYASYPREVDNVDDWHMEEERALAKPCNSLIA